jgi:hypothetical protein
VQGGGSGGAPQHPLLGHQMAHPHAHGSPPHFVITPACWIGHGPPTQKDESQVVRGSNKSAFSNVDPCALPRAIGPRSRHPRWPSSPIGPFWRGFTPRRKFDAPTHSRCSPMKFSAVGGRGAAAARWLKGGLCMGLHGASQAPSGSPPSPSQAPASDPEHTTGLKDQSASYVARGGAPAALWGSQSGKVRICPLRGRPGRFGSIF